MFCLNQRKGFTLVELIITIAIIAVLAAIAVPAIGGIIKSANQSADISAANSMTHALKSAVSDIQNKTAGKTFSVSDPTVEDVLLANGLASSTATATRLLIPKQQGKHFFYDTIKQVVLVDVSSTSSSTILPLTLDKTLSDLKFLNLP